MSVVFVCVADVENKQPSLGGAPSRAAPRSYVPNGSAVSPAHLVFLGHLDADTITRLMDEARGGGGGQEGGIE